MKTIAFINIKGGVGKTTTTTTIAHILATKYNKRVLVVDLDPQGNTTNMYHTRPNLEQTEDPFISALVYDLAREFSDITGYAPTTVPEAVEQPLSIEDLMIDPTIDPHRCIYHSKYKNLDYIPAFLSLAEAENKIQSDTATIQQFRLRSHLRKIQAEYDYCLLDTSPSVSIININGLAAANTVYVPLRSDLNSITGLQSVKRLFNTVIDYNPQLNFGGCFFQMWAGYRVDKEAKTLLENCIGTACLDICIPQSKLISEATYYHTPLLAYDPKDSRKTDTEKEFSKATKAYLALAEHIVSCDPV